MTRQRKTSACKEGRRGGGGGGMIRALYLV